MWDESTLQMLLQGVGETLYMTLGSTLFAYIIGLPLGVLLVMWAADGIRPHPVLYKILDVIVNLTRSFPFIILLIAVLPFTRWLLGTTLGPTAVIVPLTISAAPFVARLVEGSQRSGRRCDRSIPVHGRFRSANHLESPFAGGSPLVDPQLRHCHHDDPRLYRNGRICRRRRFGRYRHSLRLLPP